MKRTLCQIAVKVHVFLDFGLFSNETQIQILHHRQFLHVHMSWLEGYSDLCFPNIMWTMMRYHHRLHIYWFKSLFFKDIKALLQKCQNFFSLIFVNVMNLLNFNSCFWQVKWLVSSVSLSWFVIIPLISQQHVRPCYKWPYWRVC